MVAAMMHIGKAAGLQPACNTPYQGTMVPTGLEHMPRAASARFSSYMIEINRRLYLDGVSPRPAAVAELQQVVRRLVGACIS